MLPEESGDQVGGDTASGRLFPIVGVGASAGGLEAFSALLAHLPADTGMAFVLVQHLDPKHESSLGKLLGKHSTMPVHEVTEPLAVEANHVYVIAPNVAMSFTAGELKLEPRDGLGPHLIDHFFKSLAHARKAGAIGVVLSGTGTDGSVGLEEIKAMGGITFAQDERTAKFSGMPQSAARSGCVDLALPPEQIAQELARIGKHPYVAPPSDGVDAPAPASAGDMADVLTLLRTTFGVDFSAYRDATITRRIMRRMVLHTKDSIKAYVHVLEHDRGELHALYQDILISVTSFFRDPEMFKALETRVLPEILKLKTTDSPIRIWVPGCSTGQEAYSIAMTVLEVLDSHPFRPAVQIFATDLNDTRSIAKAREGVYSDSIESEVSPERLRRFFVKADNKYRIAKSLREIIAFAKQNVAADPPFSHLDLISCRNVLIYMTTQLQKRILPTFHYALNPGGFLVLGGSETIGSHTDLFRTVDAEHRIYAKLSSASQFVPHYGSDDYAERITAGQLPAIAAPAVGDWQREADRFVSARYNPPGVLVNEKLDIVQFRGKTGPYLSPSPGEPSNQLFRHAREDLFLELRSAVTECQLTRGVVRRTGVRIRGEGMEREIDLHVVPIKLPQSNELFMLVMFEETAVHAVAIAPAPAVGAPADEASVLRRDLASTREYLQSIIAQQGARNDDLKHANDEAGSTNEELQSANEELETAKEELQSVNEELTTVNEQLQQRNSDMNRLNDDLNNLINSSHVPTVVVDADLRIRRFTPAAEVWLNVHAGDIGRRIALTQQTAVIPDLDAMITRVIDTGQVQEREVCDRAGRWHSLRVHPYRTTLNRIEGAVAVFMDIDEAKSAQAALRDALEYAQAIIETAREPLVILDADLRVRSANPAFYRAFEVDSGATEGQLIYDLGNRQWDIPELRTLLEVILPQNTTFDGFEVSHTFESIGLKVMVLNARRIIRDNHSTNLILLAIEDRTVSAHLENELREHVAHLSNVDRERTVFLALLAHELRNPLAPILNALEIIQHPGDDPKVSQSASVMMERQVNQMVRLVDDLIDVSRISRGRIELHKERLELTAVVRDAAAAAGSMCAAKSIALSIVLPPLPVYLDADPTRMAQIVGNLLSNACKFTDAQGSIVLTVDHAGPMAVIRVRDSGIGIAADQLPRIFDMFMQIDTSLERSVGGLGIGLALVKHLVEMHGGTLIASSEGIGKGTQLTAELPLAANQSARAQRTVLADDTTPKTSPMTILVVDDNRDAADSLTMLLANRGHTVETAFSGLEAVEMATRMKPEVMFLDIGLPGLNGYEVAKRIRNEPWGKTITLIALTGWGTIEDREHSRQAGFNAHLVKPVNFGELLAILKGIGK